MIEWSTGSESSPEGAHFDQFRTMANFGANNDKRNVWED